MCSRFVVERTVERQNAMATMQICCLRFPTPRVRLSSTHHLELTGRMNGGGEYTPLASESREQPGAHYGAVPVRVARIGELPHGGQKLSRDGSVHVTDEASEACETHVSAMC